ncbi:hypothetical protein [Mesoplasma whartonense]|uniref:hypothetical protein n=1 Tax=Mesoplasma whartonense TaxID=2878854 RepID=UPI002022A4BF|nr:MULTISPECIES: hypothetical protein [unclassified Mesoplasma]
MMNFDYKQYEKALIFFFQNQHYQALLSKLNKQKVFLYSSKMDVAIIKIAHHLDEAKDSEFTHLIGKLAKTRGVNKADLKVLEIYLDETKTNKFSEISPNHFLLVSTDQKYLRTQLTSFWAMSQTLDFSIQEDVKILDKKSKRNRQAVEDFDDLSSVTNEADLQKKLSSFSMRFKKTPYYGSSIFLLLFIIVPLIFQLLITIWGYDYTDDIAKLFSGGTTYHLTFLGGQGWRVLTYGMSALSSNWFVGFAIIILVGFSMYGLLKLNEFYMSTWKFILSFLISYLLLGYFSSVLTPNYTTGSALPIYGMTLGMLALNVSGSKTLFAQVSKSKLILPIIFLIILPIFVSGMEYIPILVGLCLGGATSFLFTYDYKNANWRLSLPLVVLLIGILLPSIMLTIPIYVPGKDGVVIYTLMFYVDRHLMSIDKANNLLHKIGWTDIVITQFSNNRLGIGSLI